MSRATRRHHEDRVKAKWRKRVRQGHGPTLATWTAPPPQQDVERLAVRRAHHNKCGCDWCRRPDQDRLPRLRERSGSEGEG